MIVNVRHAGIVVKDLNKMMNFYTSLGFSKESGDIEQGNYIEQVTGLNNVKLEWVKMRSSDGFLLELLYYHEPLFNSDNIDVTDPRRLGMSHIAFTVKNAYKACENIKNCGGTIINYPAVSPDNKAKVAYCYDPENVLMEIVEQIDFP